MILETISEVSSLIEIVGTICACGTVLCMIFATIFGAFYKRNEYEFVWEHLVNLSLNFSIIFASTFIFCIVSAILVSWIFK